MEPRNPFPINHFRTLSHAMDGDLFSAFCFLPWLFSFTPSRLSLFSITYNRASLQPLYFQMLPTVGWGVYPPARPERKHHLKSLSRLECAVKKKVGSEVKGPTHFCVNCQPKRPLMQRFPCVTEWSSGELTFTICPACACTVSSQPTPQYGQIVSVRVCRDSFQVPATRMSYSVFAISAPVGQTPMQFPQYTHADSVSGISNSVAMCEWNPRPATPIANVFCASTPHASTHL